MLGLQSALKPLYHKESAPNVTITIYYSITFSCFDGGNGYADQRKGARKSS